MKNKMAGTGLALLLIGAATLDSPNISIPIAIILLSFVLTGIAFALEYKTTERSKTNGPQISESRKRST